ncbi:MAG: flagellar hook capping FlgD N-terminal domain-containing protein [Planctomycetota bacterium]|jgi:flagellar basal-body rod modification protein FlgD
METPAISSVPTQGTNSASSAAEALSGEDFFALLIAQLSNQDPLEPTSSQELLQQISSIRDIELSTALTDSLKTLTDQQRYASAAGLIGNYVTGQPDPDDPTGLRPEGVVVGVRFSSQGRALLQLDNGVELALERIDTVSAPESAATALIGKLVTGVETTDSNAPRA